MPSQPCGLHRRHSRIESVVPYTSAPAKKGQVYFGRFYLGKRDGLTQNHHKGACPLYYEQDIVKRQNRA